MNSYESYLNSLTLMSTNFWSEKEGKTICAIIDVDDILSIVDNKIRVKKAYVIQSLNSLIKKNERDSKGRFVSNKIK